MGRHSHDRARPIIDKYKIGHPNRNTFTSKRINGKPSRIKSFFINLTSQTSSAIEGSKLRQSLTELNRILGFNGKTINERMLRSQQNKRRPKNSIKSRSEHFDRFIGVAYLKFNQCTFRPTDPVPLHRENFVWPLLQILCAIKKLFSVLGNPKKPLFKISRVYVCAASPTNTVDDLFIRKHGLTAWAPIY